MKILLQLVFVLILTFQSLAQSKNTSIKMEFGKGIQFVLGFSHYFNSHSLKIQADVTYLENGSNKSLIYRFSNVVTF